MRRLRQKIEADPSQPKLMSESGIGYRLERHRVIDVLTDLAPPAIQRLLPAEIIQPPMLSHDER
jgi:hypothetical protein